MMFHASLCNSCKILTLHFFGLQAPLFKCQALGGLLLLLLPNTEQVTGLFLHVYSEFKCRNKTYIQKNPHLT